MIRQGFAVVALLIACPVEARPRKEPAPAAASTPAASSSAVAEAQTRFRRALELYQEGNLDAARTELRRAYEVAPSYKVLYNLGQIEFELQNYPAALSAFSKYLSDGGDQLPEARKAQVEKDIEKLRVRVATIEIVVNVDAAQIAIDDVAVGTSPIATPIVVSAGRRKISASRTGYVVETRMIDLGGGDHSTVQFALQEVAPARPAMTFPTPAPHSDTSLIVSPTSTRRSVPWLGWSVTALLAASAGVTGALSLDASQKLRQERALFGADSAELDRRQRQVNGLALASDLSTGAAVIAGGISLYLTLAGSRKIDEPHSVRFVPGPRSVAIAGAF